MALLTEKKRQEIAEVFRKFSQKESPLTKEAYSAIRFLQHYKGFSRMENEVWTFFADCLTWFFDKREVFALAADDRVLYLVAERFRAYMADKQKPKKVNIVTFSDLGLVDDEGNRLPDDEIKGTKYETIMPELAEETDYEAARQKAEARRWLKSWLGFLQSFSAGWRKKDPTYRLIQKLFIGPRIKVVKETLKRKNPSKK